VIVAVEGPSAAGKTTWCSRRRRPVVAEYAPTGREPDGSDEDGRAAYWVAVNSGRWREAVEHERRSGVVLCDSDPVKLHYSWCLARIGAGATSRFEHELAHTRAAFAREELGLPDAVVVSIPSLELLVQRRRGDPTRSRRSFELHARLAEPLREWYGAVDGINPGRVTWSFPDELVTPGPRPRRCDPALLDGIVAGLPALPG
jgi:hypothetical protein